MALSDIGQKIFVVHGRTMVVLRWECLLQPVGGGESYRQIFSQTNNKMSVWPLEKQMGGKKIQCPSKRPGIRELNKSFDSGTD